MGKNIVVSVYTGCFLIDDLDLLALLSDTLSRSDFLYVFRCREGGDIGLFLTLVPKVFLFVGLTTLGSFIEFDLLVHRGNFMYHHWGCTSIYRPLSYPFRSLNFNKIDIIK